MGEGAARRTRAVGGPREPRRGRTILGFVATIVVVAVVLLGVFPRIADYNDVWALVAALTFSERAILTVLGLWFLSAYWFVLASTMPSLRIREAAVNHTTGTAITNTVPTGGALALGFNYAMYSSWGFSPTAIMTGLLTAGIFDNLAKWGLPIVALSLVAFGSDSPGSIWAVAGLGVCILLVIVVLFVASLRSEHTARGLAVRIERVLAWVRRFIKNTPTGSVDQILFVRNNLVALLSHRWMRIVSSTVANHLAMFAVLFYSLRYVGVRPSQLSLLTILAGFSVARLLSMVPITAGGLGVVDAGYVAVFSLSAPDEIGPQLVAAVLLFRALTYFPPIVAGTGSWVFWRANESWRQEWRTVRRGELVGRRAAKEES